MLQHEFLKASAVLHCTYWCVYTGYVCVWGAPSVPQRQRIVEARDTGTQMVLCYPPPAPNFQGTQTAEREDFDLNNACGDMKILEVTLLIMIKHLTGS